MRLNYFHYYFTKDTSPKRHIHDLRPILAEYCNYDDIEWKMNITGEDGERIVLLPTPNSKVYLLVATRTLDIIKALNRRSLTPCDLAEKLDPDESAAFAAYFTLNENSIGLAVTHRGPRATAFQDFINLLLRKLNIPNWRYGLSTIGDSITIDEAKALEFIGRTSLKIAPRNPLFQRFKNLFGWDDQNLDHFVLTMVNKRGESIKSVFKKMASETRGEDREHFEVRGKKVDGDHMTNFFIESHGRLSDEIQKDTEANMIGAIHRCFEDKGDQISEGIARIIRDEAEYDRRHSVPELDCLGRADYWRSVLRD